MNNRISAVAKVFVINHAKQKRATYAAADDVVLGVESTDTKALRGCGIVNSLTVRVEGSFYYGCWNVNVKNWVGVLLAPSQGQAAFYKMINGF